MPRRKGSTNHRGGGGGSGQGQPKGSNNAGTGAQLTPTSPSNRRSQAGKKTGGRPMPSSPSRPSVPDTVNSRGTNWSRRRARSPSPPAPPPPQSPSPIPVTKTPMMEPVEQRWEETEGMYLHKKFKKMAKVTNEGENIPLAVAPKLDFPHAQNFPLKHSALSLLASSPRVSVPHSAVPPPPAPQSPQVPPPASGVNIPSQPVIVAHPDEEARRRRNTCPFCQLVCAKPSVLDKHIRTHTNERPYPCQPCGFAFKTRSNLYKHCKSRTHVLKVEEGIDSSGAEIMAELGESGREEIDSPHPPAATNHLYSVNAQAPLLQNPLFMSHTQQPQHYQQHRTSVSIPVPTSHLSPQSRFQSQIVTSHGVELTRMPLVGGEDAPRCVPNMAPTLRSVSSDSDPSSSHRRMETLKLPQQPIVILNRTEPSPRLPNAPVLLTRPCLSHTSQGMATMPAAQTTPTDLSAKNPAANDIVKQIDKVISHNQAIVETNDPLWARRYLRHNSKDASNNERSQARGRKYSLTSVSSVPATNALTISHASHPGMVQVGASVAGKSLSITPQRLLFPLGSSSASQVIATLGHPQYGTSSVVVSPARMAKSDATYSTSSGSAHSVMLVRQDPSGSDHGIPLNLSENRKRTFSTSSLTQQGNGSSAEEMLKAQSVRELWLQSCKKPVKSGNMMQLEGLASSLQAGIPAHPENPEGSVIKELLLQSRSNGLSSPVQSGSINLSTSSATSGSVNGQQTTIIELKHSPVASSSNEWSKSSSQIMYTNSIPSSSAASGASHLAHVVRCNMCSLAYKASDIAVHQLYHCPRRTMPGSEPSSSPKRLKLDEPTKMYGGHVMLAPNVSTSYNGLLQVAQSGLQSGGGVISLDCPGSLSSNSSISISTQKILPAIDTTIISQSSFSIPGIPTPSLAGVLTSMRVAPLFSLPGKRLTSQVEITKNFSPVGSGLLSLSSKPSNSTAVSLSPNGSKTVPFVLGIPGPYSQSSATYSTPSATTKMASQEALKTNGINVTIVPVKSDPKPIPQITVSMHTSSPQSEEEETEKEEEETFLRPSSLSLTPGSFKPKKHVMISGGATLVSPETPRPRKSYVLTYQNGTAYTHLGMKCSTRVYYCSICRPQPMYVTHKPKLSMYSNWKVVSQDSHPSRLTAKESLRSYNSQCRESPFGIFSIAKPASRPQTSNESLENTEKSDLRHGGMNSSEMIVVHSSQWKMNNKETVNDVPSGSNDASDSQKVENQNAESSLDLTKAQSANSATKDGPDDEPELVNGVKRHVEGGYKTSDDDYTYVRGRGRGRYVCNSCGIRCKKPSMLKKHIRTHTNFRPYSCKHCNFAFKTKGNLTKHMKSKAHHKKCVELGISPTAEDSQGSDSMSDRGDVKMTPGDSDSEDEDDDEDGDEDDQFEDADEDSSSANEQSMDTSNEKEAAHGLLNLSRSEPSFSSGRSLLGLFGSRPKPSTYPYSNSPSKPVVSNHPSVSPLGQVSEYAQVTQNTKKAGEIQMEETTTGLTSILSTPPVSSDRYYFHSGSKEVTSGPLLITPTSSSGSIWSMANASSGATTSTISSSSPFQMITMSSHMSSAPQIRERAADILSPVTESATILSYLDKTVSLAGRTSNPKESEDNSSPPPIQLQNYLQEKAVIRAKQQQNEIKMRKADSPMKESARSSNETVTSSGAYRPLDMVAPNVLAPGSSSMVQTSGDKVPVVVPVMKASSLPMVSGSMEDGSFAPRNVTMNVKDLPSKITRGLTPLHSNQPTVNPKEINTITQMKAVANASYNQRNEANQAAAVLQAKQAVATAEKAKSEGHPTTPTPVTTSSAILHSNQDIMQTNADGKSVCGICKKVFAKASQLRLHVNIHYMERPFRCEDCAVSFRTKGHLVKHERSAGHFNKVNINQTFGAPSTSNPRPFKCNDCLVKFRIHGHLAKHLRSKMHIMKLECSGKLPIGIFAEMERLGTNLNEIDTTDCRSALQSLQQMAERLYKDDPSKLVHMSIGDAKDSESAEESNPETEPTPTTSIKVEPMDTVGPSVVPGTVPTPRDQLYGTPNPTDPAIENLKVENRRNSFSSTNEERSTDSENESVSVQGVRCPHCPKSFNDNIAMQVHMFVEHQSTRDSPAVSPPSAPVSIPNGETTVSAVKGTVPVAGGLQPSPSSTSMSPRPSSSREGSVASSSTNDDESLPCGLCSAVLPNRAIYKQHLISHAAPRPYVCHHCDAGFTTNHQLETHMKFH